LLRKRRRGIHNMWRNSGFKFPKSYERHESTCLWSLCQKKIHAVIHCNRTSKNLNRKNFESSKREATYQDINKMDLNHMTRGWLQNIHVIFTYRNGLEEKGYKIFYANSSQKNTEVLIPISGKNKTN
jgi:hypothetical protein